MRHLGWLALALIVFLATCGTGTPVASPGARTEGVRAKVDTPSSPASPSLDETRASSPIPSSSPTGPSQEERTEPGGAHPASTPVPAAKSVPTETPTSLPTQIPSLPPQLVASAGVPISLALSWDFGANGHLTAGGVLHLRGEPQFFLGSLGRKLYSLSAHGRVLWEAKASAPVYAVVILGENQVAIGDDAGVITVFDAAGTKQWQYRLGTRVTALIAGLDGGLLAGGWDARLSQLTTAQDSAGLRWQAVLGGPVADIATLSNLAVAGTWGGEVQAFDVEGQSVWRNDLGSAVHALASAAGSAGGLILVGVQDGRVVALSPKGELEWERRLGGGAEGAPVLQVIGRAPGDEPLLAVGAGGRDPEVVLLDASGKLIWRLGLPAPVTAIAGEDLDADGETEIIAGMASGEIWVVDLRGRLRGSAHAGLAVWHLVPAGDGTVVVLADVVAWRLAAGDGAAGGAWLPPPAMVQLGTDASVGEESLPGGTGGDGEAVLVFLGDVAPGRSMEMQLARYGATYPWTEVGELLRGADLAVANLECVLTTRGKPRNKSYLIRAHPSWGETLVQAGLDLVSLANNHAMDYGAAGLDDTLDALEILGLQSVGAGRSRADAHQPAILDLGGLRVAVLAYAAARWDGSVDVPATDQIAWARAPSVKADVRAVRDQAEIVVVVLHAGTEYAGKPSFDQVAIAHAAIDAGADLVVGHHPHVVQTVERYGQGLVFYSLGDALFDIPRRPAMLGHLLRVLVSREGLVRAELWPFWIEDAIRPRLLSDAKGQPRYTVVFP